MTHLDVSHQVKTYFILEHKKGKNRKNKMLCRCAVWEHCVFFFFVVVVVVVFFFSSFVKMWI